MNEKRFTITEGFKAIHDEDGTTITYCNYLSDAEQLVDLLNKLNDENRELRKENENYKWLIEKGYGDLTYEEILEKEEE